MAIVIVIALLTLVVVLVVGAAIWLFDLESRREAEAEDLEERVAVAVHESVRDAAVRPVAYLPPSTRAPAVVEIHGRVPSHHVRTAVLRAAERALSRIRPDCRLHDRLAVESEELAA